MTQPHVIRLRGPWECSSSTGKATLAWPQLPEGAAGGEITLLRRFGCPTGISPADRVELVFADLPPLSAVTLNDVPLPPDEVRFPLSSLLPRNELKLTLAAEGASLAAEAEVRLEIFGPE